jgi:hypothetical protein
MKNLIPLKHAPPSRDVRASRPLDEVCRAWVTRGVEHDRRSSAAFMKVTQWMIIAVLIAAWALWSQVTPYTIAVQFIVAAGAIIVMSRALSSRQYAVTEIPVPVYQPVAPSFSFVGGAQQAFVCRQDTEPRNA